MKWMHLIFYHILYAILTSLPLTLYYTISSFNDPIENIVEKGETNIFFPISTLFCTLLKTNFMFFT